MTNTLSIMKLKDWHFGRHIDERRQIAKLVIKFKSRGAMVKKPLVLPFSDFAYPKKVMNELLNATADIDPKSDLAVLTDRLANLDTDNGLYLQKVGHHEEVFIAPPEVYGDHEREIVVDNDIAEACMREIGTSGSLRRWKKEVADPAEHSSFAMFGVALALTGPVYRFILPNEGAIFNLAVSSGFGKSVVAMIAKSVTGQSTLLPTWKASLRGLDEALAAGSDALLVLDDWEKLNVSGSRSAYLQKATHLITSGASTAYSKSVKENLPDLEWSCPVLTGGPRTIEEQAQIDGVVRTNGDRRRMIDIPIPQNEGAGIWDRLGDETDISVLSKDIEEAAKKNYGHLYKKWVTLMMKDRDRFVEEIDDYLDDYFQKNRLHGDGGFENTITKKFGIVFAAGMKAIAEGLLPWNKRDFNEAIVKLHQSARGVITTEKQVLRKAFLAVNEATSDAERFPYVKQSRMANFKGKTSITGFVIDNRKSRHLFLTLPTLHRIVGGKANADLFIKRSGEIGAHVRGPKGKTCVQMEVNVGGKKHRPRLLKIELDAFDEEIENLTTK